MLGARNPLRKSVALRNSDSPIRWSAAENDTLAAKMPLHVDCSRLSSSLSLGVSLMIGCFVLLTTTREASAEDDKQVRADRHYEQGKAFFRVGEYALCAAEFRLSYELVNKPGALFNQARCHEEQGDHKAAVETFRLYIAAEPNGAQVPEATARATALQRKVKEAEAVPEASGTPDETPEVTPEVTADTSEPQSSPAPVTDAPASSAMNSQDGQVDTTIAPRPSPKSHTRSILAISTGALGVAGVGIATIFAISANRDWQEAKELCPLESPCLSMEGAALSRDAKGDAQVATLFVGLSTISLAAAIYFWYSRRAEGDMAVSVSPASTGNGASVHFGMDF